MTRKPPPSTPAGNEPPARRKLTLLARCSPGTTPDADGGYYVEGELLDELRAAFEQWQCDHGIVWFDNDVRLANAVAGVLHMLLGWSDDA